MAGSRLQDYWAKRDFGKTAEPSGKDAAPASDRLRFIVQKHAATRLHWDFRLEHDGVMLSWAVIRGPSSDPSQKRLAVQTEDHPLDYGDFEGTIPKGEYGGGTVMLWDRGHWTPEGDLSVEDQLKRGELKFSLDGERMKGSWVLVLLRNDRKAGKTRSGKPRQNWLLIKHRDDHSTDDEAGLVEDHLTSIASGRAMDAIAAGKGRKPTPFMTKASPPRPSRGGGPRSGGGVLSAANGRGARPSKKAKPAASEPPPAFVAPQLARLVDHPPSAADWLHEIKFDGYRLQLRTLNGKATVKTRTGLDWSDRFPEICASAAKLPDGLIDGEATALNDDDQPDFAGLQAALSAKDSSDLVFYAFDLLHAGGQDLRPLPLRDRKAALKAHLKGADPRLIHVEHFETAGSAVLKSACSLDLEGIVSKRADAPYRSGRSDAWVKSKCRGGQEVVIAGYATTNGAFRSLIGAVRRGGELVHVGRIGTGYTRDTAEMLMKRLKPLHAKASPFGKGGPKAAANVQWVKPELVAEVEFTGWTGDGNLRHAAFKGLREDKPAKTIVREDEATVQAVVGADRKPSKTAAPKPKAVEATLARTTGKGVRVAGVPLSNPDKPLWPAHDDEPPVTKRELAEYLEAAAEWMLPHIQGRPCSLIRTPDGIEGKQRFFQRHAGAGSSALLTLVDIPDDKQPYLQIDSVEALIAAAQSGATEFHPWNCAPGKPETPGRFVFDLDPDEGLDFADVVTAAKDLKGRLEAIGLVPFLKTTGGKGLHIVTPIKAGRTDWKTAKAFTRDVCQWMVDDHPDRYTLNLAKKARGGKIFLDYLRNDRTATAVAVLSPRARPGATVSTPIKWTQATTRLNPGVYTIRAALKALKSDPWAGYDDAAKPLSAAIKDLKKARG